MTESLISLRDRLMPNIPREAARAAVLDRPVRDLQLQPLAEPHVLSFPAFALENPDTGKVTLTVPLEINREVAEGPSARLTADDFLLHLSGRLVEAEKANENGAFWTQGDLEFGMPSIALGPLNWLHDERRVVGVLTDARMVNREAAAAVSLGPHVISDALMWKWLAPREAAAVEHFSEQRQAYYSMECVSREIACVGENGCGATMDYLDAQNKTEKACEHVKEHSSARRFVNPIFQGAAIIVPPTKPGWSNADLSVQRQAAAKAEKAELEMPGLSTPEVENMVAQILQWSGTR